MYIDIAADFQYGTLDYSPYVVSLDTNLDVNALGFIDAYDSTGALLLFSALKFSGSTVAKFKKSDIDNVLVKLVARLQNTPGAYWVDDFIYQNGVVNVEFISQGESGGSGELKTFSGSITQDGNPVSRSVYALAVGGDVPKLLASTESDALGDYTLQWNGYVGQILITAVDNYGELFSASTLLNVGARIHPAVPNGYVYEVSSSGALGSTEPVWPEVAGESVTSGEVQLISVPFYRPKSAGPFTII